jgi:hypothetical protein
MKCNTRRVYVRGHFNDRFYFTGHAQVLHLNWPRNLPGILENFYNFKGIYIYNPVHKVIIRRDEYNTG